jgi:hypothetical protein
MLLKENLLSLERRNIFLNSGERHSVANHIHFIQYELTFMLHKE